ncbi:MAG: DNA-3-methyladenine glycosylase 2 family protein [Spongiibacteraceae bacterium]|nr:DNA-3-methyladenine glycosylase 2 family protein [Spongiibacteraceae bacterium]
MTALTLTSSVCRKARLARDARFDGRFFIAVKTTGIFCRPVCPALAPKEENVEYFSHALEAAQAGYRPCLRCRPDSAPNSCAWMGADTTVNRALRLIDEGALSVGGLELLAQRLGISSRYLRKIFSERLGVSPKAYALFKQLMFAKQLLHDTGLSVSHVADAAGFNSVRRFNDAFRQQLKLKPSDIRRQSRQIDTALQLTLAYRPPFDWQAMLDFWRLRAVDQLEWLEGDCYGRSYRLPVFSPEVEPVEGWFEVSPNRNKHALTLKMSISQPAYLRTVVLHIRRILDLDTDIETIEKHLRKEKVLKPLIVSGIRIPGIWHPFEAGVRAILGQQVSVAAACTHVQRLVAKLGNTLEDRPSLLLFPTPLAVFQDSLEVLKIPTRRRETVRAFAAWFIENENTASEIIDDCLSIKGIGPWTVQYIKMRALADPDIWLASDLGVKKALASQGCFDSDKLKPWRSYATFQLWRSLS